MQLIEHRYALRNAVGIFPPDADRETIKNSVNKKGPTR